MSSNTIYIPPDIIGEIISFIKLKETLLSYMVSCKNIYNYLLNEDYDCNIIWNIRWSNDRNYKKLYLPYVQIIKIKYDGVYFSYYDNNIYTMYNECKKLVTKGIIKKHI